MTQRNSLTLKQWLNMLPPKAIPAQEKVFWVTKFAQPIKTRADIWRHHFKGYAGCKLTPADTPRIYPSNSDKRVLIFPDWALEQLNVIKGDLVCITFRDDKLYLKRFTAAHIDCTIPGMIAFDEFSDTSVKRSWSSVGNPGDITFEDAQNIVAQVGRLKVDPVASLCALEGRTGYLARKNLCGISSTEDELFARSYRQTIISKQLGDGSWDGNALESAFNLMDLLEMGAAPEDAALQRGAEWLLNLPEPTGAPGAFNANQEITGLFNRFKAENPQGRVSAYDKIARDRHRRAEFLPYLAHGDIFGMVNEFCDARHLYVTGVVLQALLQCGLVHKARVNRALVTLLGRPWCQEFYHDDSNTADSTETVDLDKLVYDDFLRAKFQSWELNEAEVLRLTSASGL